MRTVKIIKKYKMTFMLLTANKSLLKAVSTTGQMHNTYCQPSSPRRQVCRCACRRQVNKLQVAKIAFMLFKVSSTSIIHVFWADSVEQSSKLFSNKSNLCHSNKFVQFARPGGRLRVGLPEIRHQMNPNS